MIMFSTVNKMPVKIQQKNHFTRKPLAIAIGVVLMAQSCLVNAQAESEELLVEEVITIGSRVSEGRSSHEMPVAVDSVSRSDLVNTGQPELGKMLQQTVPSFNFSSSSVSDGTDALRPATLRGLGPDQTLVLVNGKRRHQASLIHINTSVGRGTAGVDMNAIPIAAISRVEVLRDGAAAQYGSDAIAGVINIVLKNDDNGGNLSASYGGYSEGDGATGTLSINKGFSLGDSGFFNVSASYRDREHTNRAAVQGSCLYGACKDVFIDDIKVIDKDIDGNGFSEVRDFVELERSSPARNGFRIGDADSSQFTLVVNSEYEVGEGELYGFITYSRRENESAAFYRNPTGSNGVDAALLTDGLNPADPDGFLPKIYSEIGDVSFNFGYSVELSNDSTLNLSYTKGSNAIDYTTRNSANYSYANELQFSGDGRTDAEVRAQLPRAAYAYGLRLGLTTINLDFTKSYGDIHIAMGTELRTDTYEIIAGDKYSYYDYDTNPEDYSALYSQDAGGGIQGFPGISPTSEVEESRDVFSAYFDSEYQLTDNWMMTAALRFDEYEGFGDTLNGKLASRFEFVDGYAFRASTSTGFRAPSMQQLYFNNIGTQIRKGVANNVGTFRNDSSAVQSLGVPSLREEKSVNFSVGFTAELNSNWNFTIDAYKIDIDDRIVISNQIEKSDSDTPTELDLVLTSEGADSAQFFLNGGNTETEGVDIVTSYTDISIGSGSLSVTLAANYTETEVVSTYLPAQGALSTMDPGSIFSAQDISIIEEWQPKDRVVLSAQYQWQQLAINLAFNRYGKYSVLDTRYQTYSAEVLTDLKISYELVDGLSVYFSGNNIFDSLPDETTNTDSRGGALESTVGAMDIVDSKTVFRYSRRSAPFGFNGAFFSAGVSYDF